METQLKKKSMIQSKINRKEFGIHHYAGKVMYDAEGFVAANGDTLPSDLSDCALKSSNEIISKHLNNDKCNNLDEKPVRLLSRRPQNEPSPILLPRQSGPSTRDNLSS